MCDKLSRKKFKVAIIVLVVSFSFIGISKAQSDEQRCGWSFNLEETYLPNKSVCFHVKSCDFPDIRINHIPDSTQSITWIKFMFHNVAEDDGSNPATTPAIIDAQMEQINADFLPYGLQFIYDWQQVDSTWARYYHAPTFVSANPLKQSLYIDPHLQLNLIVTDITLQFTAYSQNPQIMDPLSDTAGQILSTFNGWNLFTADLSRHSLSHEIGHCFGLLHTYVGYSEWGGGSCNHQCSENLSTGALDLNGDYCSDTPPERAWGGGTFSGAGIDVCSGLAWPADSNINYMNVSNLTKRYFSPKQVGRMKCYIETTMYPWIRGVRIHSDIRYGQVPMTVQFTGEEHDSVGSWSWDFGDDSTSSVQNPQHTFTEPGVYTISLTGTSDTVYNAVNNSFVAVHADSINLHRTETLQNDTVNVTISATNYIPTSSFYIPISYNGPVQVIPLGISTDGLRTLSGIASFQHIDTSLKKLTIEVSAQESYFLPDSGGIVTLSFLVPPGGLDSTLLDIIDYTGYEASINTYYGSHSPMAVSGGYLVRNSCCLGNSGDLNGDGADGNILDLTFAVNYIFRSSGNIGDCLLENDVNQDGSAINILDLNYLVNYIFRNGMEPANCP